MHASVPFSKIEYLYDANHYIADPRISDNPFSLITALGQYDSQWYIKIADKGYPDHPRSPFKEKHKVMEGLLYNFFPLYPLCIAITNLFIRNIEISAFIVSSLLLLASVYSLSFVVSRWFSKPVAIKTLLLVLLFPFGIFLRGYYAEGLRLLLFIWFCYGLTQKNYLLSAVTVGLMNVASGITLLLTPFYWGVLWFAHRKQEIPHIKVFVYGGIACIPFILWMLFCYMHTGDSLIFVKTRYAWERPQGFPILYNIRLLFFVPWLPVRSFYGSRIDVLCIWLMICLSALSYRVLPKVVWWAMVFLAFSPLLVQDSISFARFTSVLFPLFVYLAVVMKKRYYVFLVVLFSVGLLISSLYFINWYWIE